MSGEAFDLTGQVAVVTGGGRGIGRAIAQGLVRHGARVAIAGRDEATLRSAAREMDPEGAAVSCHVADVRRESEVVALRDSVLERHGTLDLLVNNAGISPVYTPMERTESSDWQSVMDTNLSGVFYCCRHLASVLLEKGSGSVVNVSSVAGRVGLERQVAYCASKGGVELLTRTLALEWAQRGVRVNAVAYGFIETDMTAGLRSSEYIFEKLRSRSPMGRFGRPEEVAGAVVFLASSAASYVTGTSLAVDGGWTAG